MIKFVSRVLKRDGQEVPGNEKKSHVFFLWLVFIYTGDVFFFEF